MLKMLLLSMMMVGTMVKNFIMMMMLMIITMTLELMDPIDETAQGCRFFVNPAFCARLFDPLTIHQSSSCLIAGAKIMVYTSLLILFYAFKDTLFGSCWEILEKDLNFALVLQIFDFRCAYLCVKST